MATQNQSVYSAEFLDNEYHQYVLLAQDLMKQMKLQSDRRICVRYLSECNKMKSENVQIKFHRNRFFRYLLKTMKKALKDQSDYYQNMPPGFEQFGSSEQKGFQKFSDDRRTYVAAKIIPGFGTLIYMAVSKNPEQGWDDKYFEKQAHYIPDCAGATEELMKSFSEQQNQATGGASSNPGQNQPPPQQQQSVRPSTSGYVPATPRISQQANRPSTSGNA